MSKWKKKAIRAARELYYSEEVIEAIKNAKTESEVIQILTTARVKGD